jgi:hypothetical protein
MGVKCYLGGLQLKLIAGLLRCCLLGDVCLMILGHYSRDLGIPRFVSSQLVIVFSQVLPGDYYNVPELLPRHTLVLALEFSDQ